MECLGKVLSCDHWLFREGVKVKGVGPELSQGLFFSVLLLVYLTPDYRHRGSLGRPEQEVEAPTNKQETLQKFWGKYLSKHSYECTQPHTHSHTHTHTLTHIHTDTHIPNPHPPTHTHVRMQALVQTHTRMHKHTQPHRQSFLHLQICNATFHGVLTTCMFSFTSLNFFINLFL